MQLRPILSLLALCYCFGALAQNRALNFDGTDDYISSSYSGVTGNGARTVEAWIRTTANCNPNNGGVQNVITDWGNFNIGQRFTMNILWGNSLRLEIGGSGVSGSTAINDGLWHHVAATYDPNASTNNTKIYIDGSLEAQGMLSGVNTASGTSFIVGNRNDLARPFDGDIDEVRVWNKVLTAAEISSSMNSQLCSFSNNLKCYFQFNQGSPGGNNANIFTAQEEVSGNTGTLNNFGLTGNSSNWVLGNTNITDLSFSQTDSLSGCNFVILPTSGRVVSANGLYSDSLPSTSGCDSIYNWYVSLTFVDTSLTIDGNRLIANVIGASYQWLDCDSGFAPIPGATSPVFNPTRNGSFAVEVSKNGCTDTSSCMVISGIGITEWSNNDFRIFPNPSTDGLVNLEWTDNRPESIAVYDLSGRLVEELVPAENEKGIQLHLGAGTYLIRIQSEAQHQHIRLIVL